MREPNNSSLILPLTPLKLNYYLSQCKRAHSGHKAHPDAHFDNLSSRMQRNDNIFAHSNYNVQQGRAIANSDSRPKKQHDDHSLGKDDRNGSQRYGSICNDALDSILAKKQCQPKDGYLPNKQQRFTERPALYKFLNDPISDNRSMCQLYPTTERIPLSISNIFCRNNSHQSYINDDKFAFPQLSSHHNADIQFFGHHRVEQQSPKQKKKVNWKTDHCRPSRKTIKRCPDLENSFSEISKELTKINYELHQNSKKLTQMNRLYPVPKSNPQDSIKRANLKYAIVEEPCGYNIRPRIEYNDKQYKDLKCLMWQPSHQSTSS